MPYTGDTQRILVGKFSMVWNIDDLWNQYKDQGYAELGFGNEINPGYPVTFSIPAGKHLASAVMVVRVSGLHDSPKAGYTAVLYRPTGRTGSGVFDIETGFFPKESEFPLSGYSTSSGVQEFSFPVETDRDHENAKEVTFPSNTLNGHLHIRLDGYSPYLPTDQGAPATIYAEAYLDVIVGEEYAAPTAPTSVSLSKGQSYGESVTLNWSGSRNLFPVNLIQGYEIEYQDDSGDWVRLTTVSTTAGSGSYAVTPNMGAGRRRKFRVRAKAEYSDALYSPWIESVWLTKLDDTPVLPDARLQLSKAWSQGESVVLSWSGTVVPWPAGNPLARYEVQYIDSTGTSWADAGTVVTGSTSAALNVYPPDAEGDYRRFRVRPIGTRSGATTGAWVECRVVLARCGEIISEDAGEIHLPRLMGRDLAEKCTLYPVSASVSLNIKPLSTATMQIMESRMDDSLQVRDFVEVYTKHGSAGIYQISALRHDYARDTVQVDMQHGITTLSDSMLDGTGTISGSIEQVMRTLLLRQTAVHPNSKTPYWTFGAYYGEWQGNIVYEYSSTNLLTALTEVVDQMGGGVYLDFDQSVFPWKVNVMEYAENMCECRLRRNLSSIRVDVDASKMVTRIYPYGAGEGSERVALPSPGYVQADTAGTYGVIMRAETLDNVTDVDVLRALATVYIEQHKHPAVSLTLGARDLSDATGETMDSFRIGWTCRVPLPQYGAVYTEHITGMRWGNVYGQPDEINLTLANESANVASSLADLLAAIETSALAKR